MIGYILLTLLVLTLSWTTFNLTRKVERLESWIESYAQRIQDTQNTLDEIDNEGSFESDDEIGVVFESIKSAINQLEKITEQEI
jgi:cytochrome b|tara:strand:+ start:316 stop:567 length:252 start_codon:yes stop_codon:yes gene_type:complete